MFTFWLCLPHLCLFSSSIILLPEMRLFYFLAASFHCDSLGIISSRCRCRKGREDRKLHLLLAKQWGRKWKVWWVQACFAETQKQFEDIFPEPIQALTAVSEHIHCSGFLFPNPCCSQWSRRRGHDLFSRVMPRLWQRCELIPGHVWLRLLPSSLN